MTGDMAVKLARDVLAASRAHAFPVDLIAMAPCPFDPAILDGPPRGLLMADALKADLEDALEALLALVPDVTP